MAVKPISRFPIFISVVDFGYSSGIPEGGSCCVERDSSLQVAPPTLLFIPLEAHSGIGRKGT